MSQALSVLEQCVKYDRAHNSFISKMTEREPTKEEYEMVDEYDGYKKILQDATDRFHRQQTVILDQMYKLHNAFIPARHMRYIQISKGVDISSHNLSLFCDETPSEEDCTYCATNTHNSVSKHTPDDVGMSADDLKNIGINDDGRGDGDIDTDEEEEDNEENSESEEEEPEDDQYFSGDDDNDEDDQEEDILDIWHRRLETALSVKVKPDNVGCLQPALRLLEAPHVARWNGKFHDADIPPMRNPTMGIKKSSPGEIVNSAFYEISSKEYLLFNAYKAYLNACKNVQRCEYAMNYGKDDDDVPVENNATRRQPSRSARNNKRLRDVSSSDDEDEIEDVSRQSKRQK